MMAGKTGASQSFQSTKRIVRKIVKSLPLIGDRFSIGSTESKTKSVRTSPIESFMLTKQKQTTALLSWLASLIRSKSILLFRQIKTLSSYIPLQDLNNLILYVKDGLLAILPSHSLIKYFMVTREMAYQIYFRTIKYLSRVVARLLSLRKSTSPGKDLKTLLRYCRGKYLVTISEIKQWWTLRHNRGKSSR